jgi:plastocyanin
LGRLRAVRPFWALLALLACETPNPELVPDFELQTELGLEPSDRVFTVSLSTGLGERADPDSISLAPGDFVQFVSGDWLVHEVAFDLDSLPEASRTFLERSGQSESPPLLQRGARFVLSYEGAPFGRYPYSIVGNRASGRGVIVVAPPSSLP